tara:strand:+ start:284 stop:508 length:225 start_codon:yes stop_codon:yes gene_type:complete
MCHGLDFSLEKDFLDVDSGQLRAMTFGTPHAFPAFSFKNPNLWTLSFALQNADDAGIWYEWGAGENIATVFLDE